MLTVLYISAVSVALGQLKIVPVMEQVARVVEVSLAQAGLLVSVFTLTGIILAIPSGVILSRLGVKKLFLVLMAALALGNIIGAASNLFIVLIISRVIEGTAFAMIIMVALTMINTWFVNGGNGIATGIFTTFPAVGSFIALNVSLPLSNVFGIKTMWWLVAILGIICFVLALVFISVPEQTGTAVTAGEADTRNKRSIKKILKNPQVWIFSVFHFCIAFLLFSYVTTYPALFSGFYGLEAGTANFFSSFNGLSGILFCILSGLIIEKTNKPYLVALTGSIGAALAAFFNLSLGPSTYIIHAILTSLFIGGLALTANFCIGPQLAKNTEDMGYTMAFINLFYYSGVFFCTPAILGIVENDGWQSATKVLVAVAAAAAGLMVLLI
jgi:predicted MFS family arabinose efflux permease